MILVFEVMPSQIPQEINIILQRKNSLNLMQVPVEINLPVNYVASLDTMPKSVKIIRLYLSMNQLPTLLNFQTHLRLQTM